MLDPNSVRIFQENMCLAFCPNTPLEPLQMLFISFFPAVSSLNSKLTSCCCCCCAAAAAAASNKLVAILYPNSWQEFPKMSNY